MISYKINVNCNCFKLMDKIVQIGNVCRGNENESCHSLSVCEKIL